MSKKDFTLAAVIILLVAGFYFYLYRDSFRKPHIQISHTIRPDSAALLRASEEDSRSDPAYVVNFGLSQPCKLTSLKVVPLAELETNKYAPPVWELVSDSNSIPINGFSYGCPIPGASAFPVRIRQPPALWRYQCLPIVLLVK